MDKLTVVLVFAGRLPYLTAEAICPCIDGGDWMYKGQTMSYCANPNSARVPWCPTQDKVYDGGEFSYCEGETFLACETLKAAKAVQNTGDAECPCQEEWRYRSKVYNYCKTDNSCDPWCPVKPELEGKYGANTTYCTDDILDACTTVRLSKPKPACPCLTGGQWEYNGEPQSYCSNPTKNDRAPWCYNDDGKVKYCHGDIESSCKELEGTVPIESELCPCLSGGKWTIMGVQMSYCQLGSCPKTHNAVNIRGNNWAKCGKQETEACGILQALETEEGKTAMFGTYTLDNTGCPCWFDLTRSDCACCKETGIQCGAPMQNYCYKKWDGRQRGCPGVPASQWTLSNTGHPCVGDRSRTDCAWCAPGGGQCMSGDYGPGSANGNRCWYSPEEDYCGVTTPDSCDVTHACDSQAECVFDRKFGANLEIKRCQCKDGWVGNGIECFDATTGEASPEISGSGDVSLTIVVKTELFTVDPTATKPNSTDPGSTLLSGLEAVFLEGAQCSTDPTCNGTYTSIKKAANSP